MLKERATGSERTAKGESGRERERWRRRQRKGVVVGVVVVGSSRGHLS